MNVNEEASRTRAALLRARSATAPKRSAEALADRFKALSDPARVAIVNRIAGAPNGELCTCHLTEPLGLSQPTVSHHPRVLREAGLIVVSKKIRTITFYRLVPDAM